MEPVKETVAVKVTNLDAPVKFGLGQIGQTTPAFITWIFRFYFYLVSFATVFLAQYQKVDPNLRLEIIFWMGVSVIAVHGFSKMFGIDSKKIEMEAKDAFNLTTKP